MGLWFSQKKKDTVLIVSFQLLVHVSQKKIVLCGKIIIMTKSGPAPRNLAAHLNVKFSKKFNHEQGHLKNSGL